MYKYILLYLKIKIRIKFNKLFLAKCNALILIKFCFQLSKMVLKINKKKIQKINL